MKQKDKKSMFDTITIAWPNADGKLVETEFVDRIGRSKILNEDPRTTDIRAKREPNFPWPIRVGHRNLWKIDWIAEYLLAREQAVRSKKRAAA